MQPNSEFASRASKTIQIKDQKSRERWAAAYRLSTQSSADKPSTLRRLMQRCGGLFQHEPLDDRGSSIRLVYLLPNVSQDGLIRCLIFHASISDPYACLSYEWNRVLHLRSDQGAGCEERIILVNERPFLVRENLFDFLCTARQNSTRNWRLNTIDLSVPLWIDAICIDQSSLQEKNHQVRRMGYIYSRAMTVHSWLGIARPPAEGTGILGSHQPSASVYTEQFEAAMNGWMAEVVTGESLWSTGSGLDGHISSYITRNTYWKRAWVVQEICLAQELIIWVHTVPVDKALMHNICRDYSWAISEDDGFDQYLYAKFRKSARTSLLTTLNQFRNKQCTDPRDRVYSLLSLCSVGASSIPVNYQIELDQLAYHVLRSHPGPICLCSAMAVVRQLELLPCVDERQRPVNVRADNTPWIEVDIDTSAIDQSRCDSQYFGRTGLCDSFRPLFRVVSRRYLTGLWTADEAGYRPCGADQTTYTIRIALCALNHLGEFKDYIPLCRTAFSVTSSEKDLVRLGKGRERHTTYDLSIMEDLYCT
jgi:hypothetical protein